MSLTCTETNSTPLLLTVFVTHCLPPLFHFLALHQSLHARLSLLPHLQPELRRSAHGKTNWGDANVCFQFRAFSRSSSGAPTPPNPSSAHPCLFLPHHTHDPKSFNRHQIVPTAQCSLLSEFCLPRGPRRVVSRERRRERSPVKEPLLPRSRPRVSVAGAAGHGRASSAPALAPSVFPSQARACHSLSRGRLEAGCALQQGRTHPS